MAGMQSSWVGNYPSSRSRARSRSESTTPQQLSRTPSHDNLFVNVADISAQRQLSPTGALFLDSLVQHELETIDEAVGFAKSWIGKGSFVSSVFTLVASAMGAGCLSLPHMFRQSGLGLGIILLAFGAMLAHISLVILMSCARYTKCSSFAELVALTAAGAKGEFAELVALNKAPVARRNLIVDLVIGFYGVAAVLVYMILIGDFLSDIARSPILGYVSVSRRNIIFGSLVVLLPLSIAKNVTALRYISILSTSSIAFMTLVVLARMPSLFLEEPTPFLEEHPDNISMDISATSELGGSHVCWFTGTFRTTLQSFALALFSFNAHTNAVPVATMMEQPRAIRIWQVSLVSVTIEFVFYALIATAGYLSFLEDTKQDFIRNYPAGDSLILIVRCVYSIPVLLGVPINLSPAAASLQALARPLISADQSHSFDGHDSHQDRYSKALHVAIVILVLGLCSLLAIRSAGFADVVGLFGGFFGTLICFVWPQKIYIHMLSKLHSRKLAFLVNCVLFSATSMGMLAFIAQTSDVLGVF
eukprot:TRINITY_DN32847_c0_g1_i1.p1 TRINITY_DN32847_c0_g1~~TRINITY_DN32847_c0_g1_i1.p1  ORF type:complete len:532 (-),score=55.57 TRINITY_DN32847_c0_g1_i1:44-1639(-)